MLASQSPRPHYQTLLKGGRLTQWKGQAASCAPLAGIILALAGTALPFSEAVAACAYTGVLTTTCSGATSVPLVLLVASPHNLIIDNTFNNAAAIVPTSIFYNGAGVQLAVVDEQGAVIKGENTGLFVNAVGWAGASVTTAGTISGNTFAALAVSTGTSSIENVSVTQRNTGSLTGNNGLNMQSRGTGNTDVSIAGAVTGTNGDAVVINGGDPSLAVASTGNITVVQSAGSTILGTNGDGINVHNYSKGDVTVTTSGNVTGTLSTGINAGNSNFIDGGSVSVIQNGGNVTGSVYGIHATNWGIGNVSVTTDATVTGAGGAGVLLDNVTIGGASNFTQNGGSISGGGFGVAIVNMAGSGNVMATQTVGTIDGGTDGIVSMANGTGATSITTAGSVTGASADGIHAENGNTTTDLTVKQAAGTILGGENGIFAQNGGTGATNITAAGSVTGTNGSGVFISNTSNATGDIIVNQTSGAIAGNVFGIAALNQGGSGSTSITTSGNVNATQWAVSAENSSATLSDLTIDQKAGTISGGTDGIIAVNHGHGATHITTAGDVSGNTFFGMNVSNDTPTTDLVVSQSAGNITGFFAGVYAENKGTGMTSITTTGNVLGTNGAGVYTLNTTAATGDLTVNQQAGSINGTDSGIWAANNGSGSTNIQVSGQVTGRGTTDAGGASAISGAPLSGVGIYASVFNGSGNLVVNQAAGSTITGLNAGIYTEAAANTTDITIAGKVIATDTTAGNGIYSQSTDGNIMVNVAASGNIDPVVGVNLNTVNGAMTVNNAGAITGSATGVKMTATGAGTGTVNNSGTITGGTDAILGSLAGSQFTIANNTGGVLNGSVNVTGANVATSVFTNAGTWNTHAGDSSSFSGTLNNVTGGIANVAAGSSIATTGAGTAINNTGTMNFAGNATLTTPILNNNAGGILNASNGVAGNNTITLNGHYAGAGGTLKVDTVLGNDASATDKLHVTGNVSGSSMLAVNNVGGAGAQTVVGIDVVQVDGTSAANAFSLAAPVQAGAYQYLLKQGGNGGNANDWYLTSFYDCNLNHSCPTPVPIYRPAVANYVSGQAVNMEQGIVQLSTYHQRMGEQRGVDDEGKQTWVRPYYQTRDADGKARFDYKSRITGLQFGQEVMLEHDREVTQRAAVTLDYAYADADFNDRLRPLASLASKTGDLSSQSVALGGTYTRTDTSGGYFDLVGQLSSLHNKFNDSLGGNATQKAWRLGLSVEAGKPIASIGEDWKIEPQGQLVWMQTRYEGFDDAVSHVDGYTANVVRGRLGVRVFRDFLSGPEQKETLTTYGILNVLHDFNDGEDLKVGGASVSEKYSRTRGEIGAGVQGQLNKTTYLYGDVRYQGSFDSKDLNGYQLNFGTKIAF